MPTSPTRSCTYTYLPFTDQLTIRSTIELAERSLSLKKMLQPSLPREATWRDIYKHKPELEAQVRAICGAKDTKGAVRVFQDLYRTLSHEIHNPDAVSVHGKGEGGKGEEATGYCCRSVGLKVVE